MLFTGRDPFNSNLASPNPFDGIANIDLIDLKDGADITIDIQDIDAITTPDALGNHVLYINGDIESTINILNSSNPFPTNTLPSGGEFDLVYNFYQLDSNTKVFIEKALVQTVIV